MTYDRCGCEDCRDHDLVIQQGLCDHSIIDEQPWMEVDAGRRLHALPGPHCAKCGTSLAVA